MLPRLARVGPQYSTRSATAAGFRQRIAQDDSPSFKTTTGRLQRHRLPWAKSPCELTWIAPTSGDPIPSASRHCMNGVRVAPEPVKAVKAVKAEAVEATMSRAAIRALVVVFGWLAAQGCASTPGAQDRHVSPDTVNASGAGAAGGAGAGGASAMGNGSKEPGNGNDTGRAPSDAETTAPSADGSAPEPATPQTPGAPTTPTTPVQPIERQGRYVLELENLRFECDPANGGRITAFEIDGANVLTDSQVNAENFGSTFWTSPQTDWGWPPPPEVDRASYSPEVVDATIVLTGPTSPQLDVRIVKRFSAQRDRRGVVLRYLVENTGEEPRSLAPWEVSRVYPGGLTFFPTGEGNFGSGSFQPLAIQEQAGITWFAHDPDAIEAGQKLLADGRDGWIAHATAELLFIKVFPDAPAAQRAPGEGEIEIYANRSYVEVEQQGAYQQLAPGAQLSWTVSWYLRRLPEGLEPAVGSQALIDFARETIR